ncbi:MAG: hypothetical protein JWP26_2952 [Devosia sp.]|uniref:cytidine deaminase n=1 Tax=Devosia sp. TaxID=1871048 RepID=UPI0026341680|nr:cytidine deaminase [Devosia sp.]MDB5535494.1 hypothetical protein [Devosia sp.]MDB5587982.1 hypothetical protein [Devosia sp.]
MSVNPFQADPHIVERLARIAPEVVQTIGHRAAAAIAANNDALGANMGGVLSAADAASLVAEFGLDGVRELMLLLLEPAKAYARPPISNFFVGAVGLEAQTGNLILGGNVEFPGTHLGTTLHGEGFVATRAFSRGTDLAAIAIGEAHPCAHCRQYLSEFAASRDLELIDPLGHVLTMAQLYPWPFDPDYLGERGAVAGLSNWPGLQLARSDLAVDVVPALLQAGARAYAPYSQCPGAVVLDLADGKRITGASIESVSFNPTIPPLQAALIDLLAHGYGYDDIREVTLGTVLAGHVDYARSTAELLDRVAPDADLTISGWTP